MMGRQSIQNALLMKLTLTEPEATGRGARGRNERGYLLHIQINPSG